MRRLAPLLLLFSLVLFSVQPALAANAPAKTSDKSPGAAVATTLTTVTGLAISPLLGTGAYGAYRYYFSAKTDEERARLPWFAKPSFFVPALLVALICAFKDSLGTVLPPGMKKPLDVLETLENKLSGLVAAGAVIPFTMDALSGLLTNSAPHAGTDTVLHLGNLATIHLGAIDVSWLLNLLTIPLGVVVFALVWMTSHAINVLILLSPWGAIDAALKAARTAVLGLLTLTATLDPKIAAILSLIILVISYFTAGWAFRLTIFGSSFCWDFFTRRKHRFQPAPNANRVFSGAQLKGVPLRTYGRLVSEPENGRLVFVYKPWLVLAERTTVVPLSSPHIGKGLFFSSIRDGDATVFLLPPRYRGHEEQIAKIYRLEGGVKDAGLLKAWSVLRELFGGGATNAQVV